MGLFYNAIGADNHVHRQSIQSVGDFFYTLFAGEYRDGVDAAHRVVTQVVRPAFARIEQESVDWTDSLAFNLRKLIERRTEDYEHVSEVMRAYTTNPFDFQWGGWRDLIHLSFWGNLIAYAVHFIAMKIWDLMGADQKKGEITRAHGDMIGQLARGLAAGRNKDGENPEFTLTVTLNTNPFINRSVPALQFRLFVVGRPTVSFTAERVWEVDDQPHCPETECQRRNIKFDALQKPHLLVCFDPRDRDHLSFEMGAAIELLLLSGMDTLVMKTPKNCDFFSQFGFRKAEGVNCTLWSIGKELIESDVVQPLMPDDFKRFKNLKGVVAQLSALTQIPRTADLFPAEYIYPQDELA